MTDLSRYLILLVNVTARDFDAADLTEAKATCQRVGFEAIVVDTTTDEVVATWHPINGWRIR